MKRTTVLRLFYLKNPACHLADNGFPTWLRPSRPPSMISPCNKMTALFFLVNTDSPIFNHPNQTNFVHNQRVELYMYSSNPTHWTFNVKTWHQWHQCSYLSVAAKQMSAFPKISKYIFKFWRNTKLNMIFFCVIFYLQKYIMCLLYKGEASLD